MYAQKINYVFTCAAACYKCVSLRPGTETPHYTIPILLHNLEPSSTSLERPITALLHLFLIRDHASKMARLSIFKKLFEPKSSSSFANETSTSNNPTRPSFSKLKTSSRLRYHILRAAFRTRTTLPDSTDDDAPTNGLGFSQCLPAIDGIGTGLQLDFDHQGDGEPSTSVALAKEHSETGAFLLNHVGDSDLVISRTWCQPPERLFRSRVTTERGGINVRNSISIFSDPQYPSQIRVQPAAPFVDVSYETITSIVAVPRSPSVTLRAEETSSPSQEAPSTIVPSSPNVTLYPDSNSTSGKTNSTFLLEAADQTSLTPEPDVRNAPSPLV